MSKTIAFIPARGGSKSIKGKNIKPFYGKPLIMWNINELIGLNEIDEIVVATDSDEIAATVNSVEKVTVYRRSKENSQDHSSTESVMLEYINNADLSDNNTFILVQATSPFTQQKDFLDALEMYKLPDYNSILAVTPFKRLVWSEAKKPLTFQLDKRQRRQDFDTFYLENGAFYINSVKNIKKDNSRISGEFGFHVMPEYSSLEMDEPIDWSFGEILMKKLIDNKEFIPSR